MLYCLYGIVPVTQHHLFSFVFHLFPNVFILETSWFLLKNGPLCHVMYPTVSYWHGQGHARLLAQLIWMQAVLWLNAVSEVGSRKHIDCPELCQTQFDSKQWHGHKFVQIIYCGRINPGAVGRYRVILPENIHNVCHRLELHRKTNGHKCLRWSDCEFQRVWVSLSLSLSLFL